MSTRLEMVLPAGHRLAGGRFVVAEPIGTPGGEGAVYRAWDHRQAADVAVKVLHPGLYGLFRQAFDAQIELIATVDSQWFIEVHHHFRIPAGDGWPETAAIVMRLAERSLADLVGPGGAPRGDAVAAALATARGLLHLHRLGGTHNDVKPQNILQVRDAERAARWVLGDLGVAKLFDGTHTFQPSMDLRYAPPERLRFGHVRRPGDVFSLGMTLHEALCGELPGGYGTYEVSPSLDPAAVELVAACLRDDPAERPALDDVHAALLELAGEGAGAFAVPPRRSVTLPPAGVAAAAAGVAAGAGEADRPAGAGAGVGSLGNGPTVAVGGGTGTEPSPADGGGTPAGGLGNEPTVAVASAEPTIPLPDPPATGPVPSAPRTGEVPRVAAAPTRPVAAAAPTVPLDRGHPAHADLVDHARHPVHPGPSRRKRRRQGRRSRSGSRRSEQARQPASSRPQPPARPQRRPVRRILRTVALVVRLSILVVLLLLVLTVMSRGNAELARARGAVDGMAGTARAVVERVVGIAEGARSGVVGWQGRGGVPSPTERLTVSDDASAGPPSASSVG